MAYEFTVDVRHGSTLQVQKGILASAKATLLVDGAPIAEFYDLTIRARKSDGAPWVAAPSREAGTDKETGKKKYYSYYRIFPQNRELYDNLTASILAQYQASGNDPTQVQNRAPVQQESMPINQAFPTAGAPQQQITPASVPPVTPPMAAPTAGAPIPPAPGQGAMPNPNPSAPANAEWPFGGQ